MPYCTVQEVKDKLPATTADILTPAQILGAISEAQAEIDSSLMTRFSLPFDTTPDLIKTINILLAAAICVEETHSGDGTTEEHPLVSKFRTRGSKFLGEVINGEKSIGIPMAPGCDITDKDLPQITVFDLYGMVSVEDGEALKWLT